MIAFDPRHDAHYLEAKRRANEDIQKYGCHIAIIESSGYGPTFAYTIGLTRSYGHPELILFGLNPDIIGVILNLACAEIKQQFRYKPGELYADLIDSYDVQFVEVHKENYQYHLGFAMEYYDAADFPVLQMILPDKAHRWPWDADFNEDMKYAQPLLDRNWTYKFPEATNAAAFTTYHALQGKPIIHVHHDHDGSWQFHTEEAPDYQDGKIVSLGSMVKLDPSLNELAILNYGECADREAPDKPWTISQMELQEETDEEMGELAPEPEPQAIPPSDRGFWGKLKKLWS